ncbi:hypothetical protein [Serratia quinivorans]|uniref:hypothetical protein n=1 Tax=Serratia quinivorans TaxID=137545 RepID=UPI00217AFC18|nr:hypothetical protein [Serratia quinivorans]CAI1715452.1 Uncharacterised protein [Serratia quinivorans]CAI1799088.1 Uncharacterised protein [Serratia quinivorans]
MSNAKNYHTMTLKALVEHMTDRKNYLAVQNWCWAKERRGELTPEEVKKIKTAISAITIMKRIQKYNKSVNELESFETVRFYAVDEMEYLLRTGYDTAQKSFRDEGM